MYTNILTAGHDTTSSALSGAIWGLAQYPDEYAKLRANPALIGSMIDEALRWTNVVGHFMRTAAEDVEISGRKIRRRLADDELSVG